MSRKSPLSVGERWLLVRALIRGHKSLGSCCQIFNVSRKTVWKWRRRFAAEGRRGLRERSRRPHRMPRRWSQVWQRRLQRWHVQEPSWGPKKLHGALAQQHGVVPGVRTIARWCQRAGWSRPPRRRPRKVWLVKPVALTVPHQPNAVWTVDFKGWFRAGNGQRCEPLTVRDLFSRYVLLVRLLSSQHGEPVQRAFRALFRQRGLPRIIRVDNGAPFAGRGPAGLSALSAWWVRLGIGVEFTRPGCPQDNGAHEQFHRVLKAETTRPPAWTRQGQQHRTTNWLQRYNQIRPHEGLGLTPPARHYRVSRRKFVAALPIQKYPRAEGVRRVRSNGEIRWDGRLRFIGEAFVGQWVGLRRLNREAWAVEFENLLIGHLHQTDPGAMRPAVRRHQVYPKKR